MTRVFKQTKIELIDDLLISEISAKFFNNKLISYNIIDKGLENINVLLKFKKEKYVLRICNPKKFDKFDRDTSSLRYELHFIDYLRHQGVPAPKVVKTLSGRSFTRQKIGKYTYFVTCFDYISGKTIRYFNQKQLQEIAELQASLHNLAQTFRPKYCRQSDGPLDYYIWWENAKSSGQLVTDKIGRKLEKILNGLYEVANPQTIKGFPSYTIHADLHKENLIFSGDRLKGILDFDDCREGIFPEDMAMVLHEVLKHEKTYKALETKISLYFDAYSKIRTLTLAERKMAIYFAMIKVYQLKYFHLYHLEHQGKSTSAITDRTAILIAQYKNFIKLANSIDRLR